MADPTHRHLLLGLLSLQAEFVSRDRLVKGINQWSRDPHKPLSTVLKEQGDLTDQQQARLEEDVAQRLEKDGTVERSLAGGEMQDAIRRLRGPDLDCQCDANLSTLLLVGAGRHDHEHMVPDMAPAGHAVERSAIGQTTSGGGRFRVLRQHAHGGLGEVFVACDDELHREVALKEIQPQYADHPDLRARFVMEAEVTGGLEHPGIVPVYGLGFYADGRPFYAMRFIRGESLGAAIRPLHGDEPPAPGTDSRSNSSKQLSGTMSWSRSLRQLLGRFVAVCNAVAYAHSRGVIHRDIKPENIMLGPFGETLLVDWGLAKFVGSSSPNTARSDGQDAESHEPALPLAASASVTPTSMGDVVGTPAFMSPEQAAGLIDQLGPATDIYSLGATLYMLLCGHPPFSGGFSPAMRSHILAGRFPPPRTLVNRVPAALEAICLKAMAVDPARRYASARELAGDIEAWLADEPVRAWREPLRIRAGRWMRRHRTLVAGSVATLLVALVSLVVGVALLTAANGRERKASLMADQRRQEATKNYKIALGVINNYVVRVSEDPELEEAGMEPLREGLLKKGNEALENLFPDRPADRSLLAVWAELQVRRAQLLFALKSVNEAIAILEKVRAEFESLLREDPENAEAKLGLIAVYVELGRSYQRVGRVEDAGKIEEMARTLDEEILYKHPDDISARDDLAKIYENLGRIALHDRRLAEAEKAYRASLKIYQELRTHSSSEAEYTLRVAQTYNSLGVILTQDNRFDAALDAFKSARDVLRPLAEKRPQDRDVQEAMAGSNMGIGNASLNLPPETARAAPALREAIAAYQRLIQRHPHTVEYQADLARARHNLGGLLDSQHNLAGAKAEFTVARELWRQLASDHPEVLEYSKNWTESLTSLARYAYIEGRNGDAAGFYRESIEVRQKLAERAPGVVEFQAALGDAIRSFGENLLINERYEDAYGELKKSLKVYAELQKKQDSVEFRVVMAGAQALLGRAAAGLGHSEEALDWAAKAMVEAEAPGNRDNSIAERVLYNARLGRAEALSRLGRHAEALALWDKIIRTSPGRSALVMRLGHAEALARAGRHAEAVAESKTVLEIAKGWGWPLARLAGVHAMAAASAAKDSALVPADRNRVAEADASAAVGFLEQARTAGYFQDPAHEKQLKEDGLFAPLRNRDDFRKLLEAVSQKVSPGS